MNHPDSDTRSAMHIGPRTLLELCLDLRMAANGSADPISERETDAALAYLWYRIQRWTPSGRTEERFDEAVRALVLATIAEVEERRLLAPVIQSPITDAAIDAAVAESAL